MSSKSSSAAAALEACFVDDFATPVDSFFVVVSALKRSSSDGPAVLDDVAFSFPLSLDVATGEGAFELGADFEASFFDSSSVLEAFRLRSGFSLTALSLLVSLVFPLSLVLSNVLVDVDADVLALPDLPD